MPSDGEQAERVARLAQRLSSLTDADRVRRDVEVLAESPRSHRHDRAGMRRSLSYVETALAEAGWETRRAPFFRPGFVGLADEPTRREGTRPEGTRPEGAPPRRRLRRTLYQDVYGCNLLARRPGPGPGTRRLLVVAHLDTVRGSPGADDNASGVAAVLELARVLGTGAAGSPPVDLAVVDQEEIGLLGSSVLARTLQRAGALPVGAVALECVGCYKHEPGTQRLPAGAALVFPDAVREVRARGLRGDTLLVAHRRRSAGTAQLVRTALAATDPAVPAIPLRDLLPEGRGAHAAGLLVPPLAQLARSDHAPFWRRGVPALMITDSANYRNDTYHTPADRPDLVDGPRVAAVAAGVGAVVTECSRSRSDMAR